MWIHDPSGVSESSMAPITSAERCTEKCKTWIRGTRAHWQGGVSSKPVELGIAFVDHSVLWQSSLVNACRTLWHERQKQEVVLFHTIPERLSSKCLR
jgi:hypothetical protein